MQYQVMNIVGHVRKHDRVKLNPCDHIGATFADAFQKVVMQSKLHIRLHHLNVRHYSLLGPRSLS